MRLSHEQSALHRFGWLRPAGLFLIPAILCAGPAAGTTGLKPLQRGFLDQYCFECHDAEERKGGLDLAAFKFDPQDPAAFATWVKVHERLTRGEMPPKRRTQPESAELAAFLRSLEEPLIVADKTRTTESGRAVWRRLNRYEYENTLRDLLHAPWLQLRDMLPEDGESHRFNKVGEALQISHVQVARYLGAADYALRQTLTPQVARPATKTVRYYTRDQRDFAGRMRLRGPDNRKVWPLLDSQLDDAVIADEAPMSAGEADPAQRDREAMGLVISTYQPTLIKYTNFMAPVSGRYRVRLSAYSFWMAPDFLSASRGRRPEPVTLYAIDQARTLRKLGGFDVEPEDRVPRELEVWLAAGDSVRPDAARLFRSWPPDHKNPLMEADGQPGVAFRWLEVEGPLLNEWPGAGHRLLFGDLPLKETVVAAPKPAEDQEVGTDPPRVRIRRTAGEQRAADAPRGDRAGRGLAPPPIVPPPRIEAVSTNAVRDAQPLLLNFMRRAYRRPVMDPEAEPFQRIINQALEAGHDFTEAMIAGYTAVLASPGFLYFDEQPGRLDDYALAARLSYFLWNSTPDAELLALAAEGRLHRPEVLRAQTNRLLDDPKSRRFVDAFLDYWLDLRKATATAPDAALYPDYQLDDLLVDSLVEETQLFFAELLRRDLGARNFVASDFAMLNERLATHYGIAGVAGIALRPVSLSVDSPRGGLLTQGAVLKVTANGTTTSPVLRGAWIMERILGDPPQPPPPGIPAVEPDTRGAVTIREQLDKHRAEKSCAACHSKIDPPGLALESFDVMGAWRDRYRSLGAGEPVSGVGHNSQGFIFKFAKHVDPSGVLADGRSFNDVRDLKRLLLANEEQVARNLVEQLLIYATGAVPRFSDRPDIRTILAQARPGGYGVRSLIHGIVDSEIFQTK